MTQQAIEQRVRNALHAYAIAVEPDRKPPPLPIVGERATRGRSDRIGVLRTHRATVLTTAAVVLTATGIVAAVVYGSDPRSIPPGTPPVASSGSPTPHAIPHARNVRGVEAVPVPKRGLGSRDPDIVSIQPNIAKGVLVAGRTRHFFVVLSYPKRSAATPPAMVVVSAQRAVVGCPEPFTALPGHAYRLSCVVTPDVGQSVVSFLFRLPDGHVDDAPAVFLQATS